MKDTLISIVIVDYKDKNPYLIENLEAIKKQTHKNFEIVLVTDYKNDIQYPNLVKKSFGKYVGPAEKRDIGAKMAKGEIVVFIDDDAYPSKNWLKNIAKNFEDKNIVGVGGPGTTPPNVSWQEEASGWASASPLGSGSYLYRFLPAKRRYVDDYPSMNLAVRKEDFLRVGGFDSSYYPGEDTKLCLDLVTKTGKKIIYDPKVLVFHHRRPVLYPHMKQNGNFGIHRGFFARVLPQTSFRLIYFIPSLFLIYVLTLPFTNLFFPIYLYFSLLLLNALWIIKKSRKFFQGVISIPVIFITHLWYGARFLQGLLFTDKLKQ